MKIPHGIVVEILFLTHQPRFPKSDTNIHDHIGNLPPYTIYSKLQASEMDANNSIPILFAVYMIQMASISPFPIGRPFAPKYTSNKQTRTNNKRRQPPPPTAADTDAAAAAATPSATPEAASKTCKKSRVIMTTPAGDIQCTLIRIKGSPPLLQTEPQPTCCTYFEARLRHKNIVGRDVMVGLSNFYFDFDGFWKRPKIILFSNFRLLSASNNNKDINEDVVVTYAFDSYQPNSLFSSVLSQQSCIYLKTESSFCKDFFESHDNLHIRHRSQLKQSSQPVDGFLSRDSRRNVTPHRENFIMANLYLIKRSSQTDTPDRAIYDLMGSLIASWLTETTEDSDEHHLVKAFGEIVSAWQQEGRQISNGMPQPDSAFVRHRHSATNVTNLHPQDKDQLELILSDLENQTQDEELFRDLDQILADADLADFLRTSPDATMDGFDSPDTTGTEESWLNLLGIRFITGHARLD